ncbi:hypothetical protein [Streptomyces virginiae]|uniref:hypothetical protein n=1 Tax=Streptomyces virginiae TaxID=1961 RepID=UPI0036BD22A6
MIGWDALTFAAAAALCARIKLSNRRVKVRSGFLSELREGWHGFRAVAGRCVQGGVV